MSIAQSDCRYLTPYPRPGLVFSKSVTGPSSAPAIRSGKVNPKYVTAAVVGPAAPSTDAAASTAATLIPIARLLKMLTATPLQVWPARASLRTPLRTMAGSGVHRLEELGIALGVAQLVEQEVDRVHGAHRIEDAAQDVHLLELIGRGEQLLLAGAGAGDVHRREGALVGDLAIEDELRVAGALEMLEAHLVP